MSALLVALSLLQVVHGCHPGRDHRFNPLVLTCEGGCTVKIYSTGEIRGGVFVLLQPNVVFAPGCQALVRSP